MGKPYKVVICGLKGIGKTTLIEQLIYNNLDTQVRLTDHYCLAQKIIAELTWIWK